MSEVPAIAVFAQKDSVANYLEDIVRGAGLTVTKNVDEAIALLVTEDGKFPAQAKNILWIGDAARAPEAVRVLKAPLRAGDLVALLQKTAAMQAALPAQIEMGNCVLDTRDNLWLRPEELAIRLTEKETAILVYLKQFAGKPVTREMLLTAVWSYADTVETHTLETHIYRLRQKIERDPSNPDILVTMGDGYAISG